MTTQSIQILLSTYNGELYLTQLLDSLKKQTCQDFQLLVRDDGSTDDTRNLLSDQKIISSESNIGTIASFSSLLTASTAPYVMFADQDDVWLPGKVTTTLRLMQHMEELYGKTTPILVHSDLVVTDQHLKVIHPSFWSYSKLDPFSGKHLASMLTQNSITGCTIMLNRALADCVGEIPSCVPMHDHWIGLVAAAIGKIGVVPEATLLYRQHNNNDTGAQRYSLRGMTNMLRSSTTRKRLADNMVRRRFQAEELLKRYGDLLSHENGKIIEAYLRFHRSGVIQRLQLMREHGFARTGFLRTLKELIS